ncbi:hypothetical protein QBC35DRAFT_539533 [Podospora australis]|uniref:Uncharacterized protein n=1 Tax=Podospora australis TaxID=1536484 RepID=A0AAN7AMH6_9PEZI|nr:hypothetical protein QBC35DRAFT_539533 [Podospora australis]
MKTYEIPTCTCENCLRPIGPSETRATTSFTREDPEYATLNSVRGHPEIARCTTCRTLITELHAWLVSSTPADGFARLTSLEHTIDNETDMINQQYIMVPSLRPIPALDYMARVKELWAKAHDRSKEAYIASRPVRTSNSPPPVLVRSDNHPTFADLLLPSPTSPVDRVLTQPPEQLPETPMSLIMPLVERIPSPPAAPARVLRWTARDGLVTEMEDDADADVPEFRLDLLE